MLLISVLICISEVQNLKPFDRYGRFHQSINGVTLCMLGIFLYVCCHLLIFSKFTSSKSTFSNTIRVSNNLDPNQDRHSMGPDLGTNCLQGYQQTTKITASWQRVKETNDNCGLLTSSSSFALGLPLLLVFSKSEKNIHL